jgi:hypothetical protein
MPQPVQHSDFYPVCFGARQQGMADKMADKLIETGEKVLEGTFTLPKKWPGLLFRINEDKSYVDNNGVKQVVIEIWDGHNIAHCWRDFAREPENKVNQMRGIGGPWCDLCDEPTSKVGALNHDDWCSGCWDNVMGPES